MIAIRLLWLVLCLLWLVAEFKLARTKPAEQPPIDYEQHSQRWLWLTAVLGLGVALLFKTWAYVPLPLAYLPRQLLALTLFASGLTLRYYAIKQLGVLFTTDVQISPDHQLISTGVYRTLRHPAYTGLVLAFIAIGIAMGDALALLAVTLPLLFALKLRIALEEDMLCRQFGDTYRNYCHSRWCILPWLW